ncbi:pro-FMRFamide-related neuropeptide FF isoform X1 [Microcebus murinus]|uniref:pro-FMRFamide-related neuropeptide FF isoform X1 n=1 Tax=Microcebus murinus TaxID=30608 RepID=UPI000989FC75|nr:pro-FMRFamide-related neuropeptide FF isoform X1 [Microcebus murinus]
MPHPHITIFLYLRLVFLVQILSLAAKVFTRSENPTIYPWKPLPSPCDLSFQGICPSSFPDTPLPQEEDNRPRPPKDAQTPGSLLRSLLQAMERPGRSPAFLFQPQRFGRNTQGTWSNARLSPRAGEGLSSQFWSLAAPQRFGKK